MKYKFKTFSKSIKINCNHKLAKLFNILNQNQFTIAESDEDYVKLINKKFEIRWYNSTNNVYLYSSVDVYPNKSKDGSGWSVTDGLESDWVVINRRGYFNKYKDSDHAINTSHYSLEEIINIISKICSINIDINSDVSNRFYSSYTKVIKLLDCPNSGFGTDVEWKGFYGKSHKNWSTNKKWNNINKPKYKSQIYE